MARAEDELCKALSVAIVGDLVSLSVDVLVDDLACCYELLVESLEFHHLSHDDGLLVLLDEPAAIRVYNVGRPLLLPPFTLYF